MAEPTPYDLQQDAEINELKSLITAEYQPPAGVEYSFPVASQGITQEQWQQMMMPIGDGSIVQNQHESSYILRTHTSDAETNQRNTLILEAGEGSSGKSEAVMAGFFHRLTESIELPFPPVTTTTVYHVTITYDPREFKTNPLKIQVYPGAPPTTHGRQHHRLYRVTRRPNELLSQATIEKLNPWISPVITVFNDDHLPEPRDLLYGTVAFVVNSGGVNKPSIFVNRGTQGWVPALRQGRWQDVTVWGGWSTDGSGGRALCRRRTDGIDIIVRVRRDSESTANTQRPGRIPFTLRQPFRSTYWSTSGGGVFALEIDQGGNIRTPNNTHTGGWLEVNTFIPDWYITD